MASTLCPDPETVAAYVDGRLSTDELAEISHHLVDCDACYESVAATVRLIAGGGRTDDIAPGWALAPAMVTGAVMAVVLTLVLLLLD